MLHSLRILLLLAFGFCFDTGRADMNQKIYRGVNINAQLTENDIRELSEWGANLVRANFAFKPLISKTPPYDFDEQMFVYLDQLIGWCEKYKMAIVIDPHTAPGLSKDTTTRPKDVFWTHYQWHDHLVRLWEKIALRYKDKGPVIAGYDLLNEPSLPKNRSAQSPSDWNLLVRKLTKAIRKHDHQHSIIVELPVVLPGNSKNFQELFFSSGLEYLEDFEDPNWILSAHMYLPFAFTHQQISKGNPHRVGYPGKIDGKMWDASALEKALSPLAQFQKKKKRPVFIGEFSAVRWSPDAQLWLADAISIFEKYGWSWAYHSYRASDLWDAEASGSQRLETARLKTTPRKELLLKSFKKNSN